MSRLLETTLGDIPGWQWDAGPIFVGVDGRELAIEYGKAVQRVEELTKLAKLYQQRVETLKTLRLLERCNEKPPVVASLKSTGSYKAERQS